MGSYQEMITAKTYSAEEVVDFIIDNQISWHTMGLPIEGDAEIHYTRRVGKFSAEQELCKFPWLDGKSIIEGLWFLMDMEKMKDNAEI